MGCFDSLTPHSPTPPIADVVMSSIAQGGDGVATIENSNSRTPRSSDGASSCTLDLTQEYAMAVQTSSYNEMWSKIHDHSLGRVQVLNPDRDSIERALHLTCPNKLTRLVSNYFDSSEDISHLCLNLQHSIDNARSFYRPICDLVDNFPCSSSSITQAQCDWAFNILTEFHHHENPFPLETNFDDIRQCFSQLKVQLDRHLRKAHSCFRLFRCSTKCFAALVATPFLTFLPTNFAKRQLHHISQLDAAAKGTYVLHNDLYTIERLVARLHATVESDKDLVWYGLGHGGDKYPILEVVKQLQKNHPSFLHQLKDLEEHVCLCFATVNRARSLLLQEMIHLHQTRGG